MLKNSSHIGKKPCIINELSVHFLKVAAGTRIAIIAVVSFMPTMRTTFDYQTNKVIPNKYFSERYWAYDVPSELNKKYDLLTTAEQEELVREWGKTAVRTFYYWSRQIS